eukprot:4194169-Amphidinium_carterae.1
MHSKVIKQSLLAGFQYHASTRHNLSPCLLVSLHQHLSPCINICLREHPCEEEFGKLPAAASTALGVAGVRQ